MYSDGSSATCYPTLNLKEENHLRQLFLEQDYSKRQLTEEQVCRVLSRLRPSMRQRLKTEVILPLLSQRAVLIDTEMDQLEKTQSPERLVEFLMNKGTSGIEMLYLCLLESSEQARGVPCHYQLARELKEIVQAELGISVSSDLTAVSSTHQQQQSLQTRVKKLFQIPLDPETAKTFTANLGLSTSGFRTPPTSFQAICQCWLSQGSAPGDLDQLVEALVITRGLGRHTSCLCSPASAASLEVRNFLLSLGERWVELAGFLGFSGEEVGAITEAHASNTEHQVVEFLKLWQLPECGQRTLPLMHKLKALAGIVEPRNTSRRLSNRPGPVHSPVRPLQIEHTNEPCVTQQAFRPTMSQPQPLRSTVNRKPYHSVQPQQPGTSDLLSATATSTFASPGNSCSATPVGVPPGASTTLSVASTTSSDAEVSARIPSLIISDAEWDELRKKDLFPSELVKDSNIPSSVYNQALPQMYSELQSMLDIGPLLPVMRKRCILTDCMESKLRRRDNPKSDEINTLIFDARGRGRRLTEQLFLCFLDCHESQSRNECNFCLASALKRNALVVSGVSLERQQECNQQQNTIHNAIKTIQPDVTIDRKTATKLSKNLGICMSEMSSGDLTVVSICERWRQQNSTGKIDHLTRALLSTRGLGRLVSGFCPPTSSNPPMVRRLMSGLQKDWTKLAFHLGYTHEETTSITEFYPDVPKQIEMFLRVFRMPNLGDNTESTLLNAIKLVRPRCSTVGLIDQPTQPQAMSGATYINNMNIIFPFHPYHHHTRTTPRCNQFQGLPWKREMSTSKLLGFSSESETQSETQTETDTVSITNTEDSAPSRSVSPLSMTGHEQEGVDYECSTSNSDQEKQMVQTVTSSDSEGLQKFATPHYQQRPPEPPTTRPLMDWPTHDRLSSPSDKKICGPIEQAPTSDDQSTEDYRQKQRQLSRNKHMVQLVTSSDSEGLQECTAPHYPQEPPEPPTTLQQPLTERSTHDQLSSPRDKEICDLINPAPTTNDGPTESRNGGVKIQVLELFGDQRVLQTVTKKGLQKCTTCHNQQGPLEPPTTQPLIKWSTHDFSNDKNIRGPMRPAPKSDDQQTEGKKQKQFESELSKKKQMLQTVTSSDSEGLQEYTTPHYQQGLPEPPATQPLMERSSHDRLSVPSDKEIRGPIEPVPTSYDQLTEVNKTKQRHPSRNKPMLHTVTGIDSEGLQEYKPHYQQGPPEPPTTQPSIQKSTHDRLSSSSDRNIRSPIKRAPKSDNYLTQDKKQKNMEDFENVPVKVKYSHKDYYWWLNEALRTAELLTLFDLMMTMINKYEPYVIIVQFRQRLDLIFKSANKNLNIVDRAGEHSHPALPLRVRQLQSENRRLREENQRLRQSHRHSMQENSSPFHGTPGSTSRNQPSRILQPATPGPMQSRRISLPSEIPDPLHTYPSPPSLQSTAAQQTSRTAKESIRRSSLVQSVQETQEGLYVLCLYSPVNQMVIPVLAISISDLDSRHESTQRLQQKLEADYDGHRFILEPRFPVRFRNTTARIDVISLSPEGYEVIPKQRPTEITKEEVDIRRADDLPANIIFRMKRQWNIRVDQHSICVCLGVNGLDRPYEYEPVVDIIPSPVQPQGTWVDLISQHLHHKWYELGRNLRLNRTELRNIRTRHSDDIGRCRSVIKKWANNNGSLNNAAVRQILIEAVRNTDESGVLADILEQQPI